MNQTKSSIKLFLTKAFISLIAQLSLKNCHRLGAFVGWLFSVFPTRLRHVTKTNIHLCFPEMDTLQQKILIKKSLTETGKTFVEASPMWIWNKHKLFHLIKKIHNEDLLKKALSNNNGVILALPHLGNWELLGLYCSANYATTSMYQKPKMVGIDAIIKNGRERFGAKLVSADNHGVRAMYKALKNNECVCILPDQVPNQAGVFSLFFGIQAYSMTLVSRLTKKTKASVIIAYTKRLTQGEGYEIIFTEVKDMAKKINSNIKNDAVNYLNLEMEKSIRDIPEQYQWGYKRFRSQPMDENGLPTNDYYNR